ncbi:MAG: alpha/beta hydrolase [Rhodococcus sp.]|nr:alpha/beta hydrolase [Rhodococcus sp. (in: high G+C Gram-positive bacteria)]
MTDAPHTSPSPPVRAMLDTLNANFPAVHTMTGLAARAAVAARRAPNPSPQPVGRIEDHRIGSGVRVRVYVPDTTAPTPLIVFAHGGGFVFCDLDSHDGICRAMCNATTSVVVSVEYRLAPEHRAPAAAEDVYLALEWAHDRAPQFGADPARLAVAGDSAGGNLAAVVAITARDRGGPHLRAQALLYPVIDDDFGTDSYRRYADGYYNTRAAMQWYWQQYAPGGALTADVSPMRADTLTGLPQAVMVTAGLDPLHDEGVAYAQRLRSDSVPVRHLDFPGLFHGFLSFPSLAESTAAADAVWAAFRKILTPARSHSFPR